MRIRAARVTELPALQAIERAAGRMFRDIGMPEIAQYDPWPLPVMAARHDAGRLWVVAGDDDGPVAYLMADLVDGCRQPARADLDHVRARALGWAGRCWTTPRTGQQPAAGAAGADGHLLDLQVERALLRPVRVPDP